jgi:hypothetical protein
LVFSSSFPFPIFYAITTPDQKKETNPFLFLVR